MKSFAQFALVSSLLDVASALITSQNLTTLTLYEQYAAAAYCDTNTKGKVPLQFNCAFGNTNCSLPQANGATIVTNVATLLLDVEAFVAVDKKAKLIVASFRGTCGARSALNDASAALQELPIRPSTFNCGPTCLVQPGFFNAWVQVRTVILNSVSKQLGLNPGFTVVTTGHSLGGAISHYAGFEIRNANKNVSVDLVSYGSPTTGNQDWANALQAQDTKQGRNIRVQHNGDIVPFLPNVELYRHTFPVFFIQVRNLTPVTTKDVDVLLNQTVIPRNVDASGHSFYIGNISSCNACTNA